MIVVDTWLVFNAFKNAPDILAGKKEILQKDFYAMLAPEELINNVYGSIGSARRPRSSPTNYQDACMRALENGCARAGVLVTHLTPVKRLRLLEVKQQIIGTKGDAESVRRSQLGNAATAATVEK